MVVVDLKKKRLTAWAGYKCRDSNGVIRTMILRGQILWLAQHDVRLVRVETCSRRPLVRKYSGEEILDLLLLCRRCERFVIFAHLGMRLTCAGTSVRYYQFFLGLEGCRKKYPIILWPVS